MKKLLIYAHYYAPDMASTGQLLQDMAEGMKEEFDVTVICTVPSYGGTVQDRYKEKKIYREEINGVHVLRTPVPEFTKSNKVSRIRNLLAYLFGACKATTQVGRQDYVFTISQPPILGGILGVLGKWMLTTPEGKKPKLIYTIQDFNPEQTEAVGYFKNKLLLGGARMLDNFSCRRSDLVITVGRDLIETLKKRFAGKKVPNHVMINNWIDEKRVYPLPTDHPEVAAFRREYGLEGKFVIMYSGNLGLYYDLENLLKVMELFEGARTPNGREVVFAFVGDGTIRQKLMDYKTEKGLDHVAFAPYQDKDRMIYSLNAADVHWCVNAKGIKGVSCPSKFYGICGVGKPVLAVLEKDSEIEMLIREIGCGLCSEPEDYEAVKRNLEYYISHADSDEMRQMGVRGYEYLALNLTKKISVQKYKETINNL